MSSHLSTLRQGRLGKELRNLVTPGNGKAIVNADVYTVSDFVEALKSKKEFASKKSA